MSKCNCILNPWPGMAHAFDCFDCFDETNRKLAGIYPTPMCMYCGKPECTCQEDRNKAMNALLDNVKLANNPRFIMGDLGHDPYNHVGRNL